MMLVVYFGLAWGRSVFIKLIVKRPSPVWVVPFPRQELLS